MTDEKLPQEIGGIYRYGRLVYFVNEADDEAFICERATFQQYLTKHALKGCKVKDIIAIMEKG